MKKKKLYNLILSNKTYIRPHKHYNKSESLHVIYGSADVIFFDDVGNIIKVINLSKESPKFTFPYSDHIVILELSSDKSHQSDNKYCEQTRRDICRKGIVMNNLVSLSILETMK